jgi:hypothetical protein
MAIKAAQLCAVPGCRVLSAPRQNRERWLAPALELDGDWPRIVLYNAPAAAAYPEVSNDGRILLRRGGRTASLFAKERGLISKWLTDEVLRPPDCGAQLVFLVKSAIKAEGGSDKGDRWGIVSRPSYSADQVELLCLRAGMSPAKTTVVMDACCARYATEYTGRFQGVRPAGPFEQLRLAYHAQHVAAFLTDEHWWCCFFTQAKETHVFYDPRRGRG